MKLDLSKWFVRNALTNLLVAAGWALFIFQAAVAILCAALVEGAPGAAVMFGACFFSGIFTLASMPHLIRESWDRWRQTAISAALALISCGVLLVAVAVIELVCGTRWSIVVLCVPGSLLTFPLLTLAWRELLAFLTDNFKELKKTA